MSADPQPVIVPPADAGPTGLPAAAFFASLSRDLLSGHPESPTIERIIQGTLRVITSADHCGITLRRGKGRLESVAPSHPVTEKCDALQHELREGPCVDAALEDVSYLVDDVRTEPRWPTWGPAVAELGVRSVISVQLGSEPGRTVQGPPLGAINIYSRRVAAFTVEHLELASIYATHAALALLSARRIEGLEAAIRTRELISIAHGIVMQRYDLTMDQAFNALLRYSSQRNIKLRDLARSVVEHRELPALEG